MTDQLSLFGSAPAAPVVPVRSCPPVRQRGTSPRGQTPQVATEVLAEVRDGRYGLLDDTDTVMVFTDDQHVRKALDDTVVHHLITAGLVRRGANRETVSCLHGVVRRPVTPLSLTRRGREQLARWTALRPLR